MSLPPSAAKAWSGCFGWEAMQKQAIKLPKSEEQLMGDEAHEQAARLIHTGEAPSGLTPDLELAVLDYAADVKATIPATHHIEETLVGSGPIGDGACDAWHYDGITLTVWEAKFGHSPVFAFLNEQLTIYAFRLIQFVKPEPKRLVLKVIQPRCFTKPPVDIWEPSIDQVRKYHQTLVDLAHKQGGMAKPGSYCAKCDARTVCPAAIDYGLEVLSMLKRPLATAYGPKEAGNLLALFRDGFEHVKSLKNAYEAQIEHQIKSGERVERWGLKPTGDRVKWKAGIDEVKALGGLLGIPLTRETPVTPKQAIAAGVPEEIIEPYVERLSGTKLHDFTTDALKAFSND